MQVLIKILVKKNLFALLKLIEIASRVKQNCVELFIGIKSSIVCGVNRVGHCTRTYPGRKIFLSEWCTVLPT